MMTPRQYRDTPVDVKLVLCALWVTMLFVFAYVDIFGLYRADVLDAALDGRMATGIHGRPGVPDLHPDLHPAADPDGGSDTPPDTAGQPNRQHRRQLPLHDQHHRVVHRRDVGLLPPRQPHRSDTPRRHRPNRLEMAASDGRTLAAMTPHSSADERVGLATAGAPVLGFVPEVASSLRIGRFFAWLLDRFLAAAAHRGR